MSKLAAIKAIVDIANVGAQAAGAIADRILAKQNQERDEKIRELQRQIDDLKKTDAK